MGNTCCCNNNHQKESSDSLNLQPEGLQSHNVLETELIEENVTAKSINFFKTHPTISFKGSLKTSQNIIKPGLIANLNSDIQNYKKLLDSTENNRETSLKSSRTINAKSPKAIVVDPSQFRTRKRNSILDNYELKYCLGKGSFGEVRMIQHKETSAKRAVKLINKKNCTAVDNLLEEFEILKKLAFFLIIRRI